VPFGHSNGMRKLDPTNEWESLLSFLPEGYERLAIEHRLVNPQWSNGKVSTAKELLRFIFVHAGADLALRQTVAVVAKGGGPKISAVRLHQKMRKARPYLAALIARMIGGVPAAEAAPQRWGDYEMVCVDATAVCSPGAVSTSARVHAVIRLADLGVLDAQVTSVTEGETLRRFKWTNDQLIIADRGYSNAPGVAAVLDAQADVLVRLNRGSMPIFTADGELVDVLEWCRALTGNRARETAVHVVHRDGKTERRIDGRLIGFRLPPKEAADAQARVMRENADATAEHVEAAAYVILFTTAPARRLAAAKCIEAYRLRWQVELQFKRWKSICHLDRLPNYLDDTVCSWLSAKILLGLILDRIGSVYLDHHEPASSRPFRALALQPWKLTSIIWPMIISALMPIRLPDIADLLPDLVAHLSELDGDDEMDSRQLTSTRNRFFPEHGTRAA